MKKAEFTKLVAEKYNMTLKQAADVPEFIMETIYAAAIEEGRCKVGNHMFKKKHRKERMCRNPHTGGEVKVPARDIVAYKYTKAAA